MKSDNVVWHKGHVDLDDRRKLLNGENKVIWFTGFSGAGKSTIAHALEKRLYEKKIASYVLDGDNVRHGLCGNLGFTLEDRKENIRRVGEACKLMHDAGLYVMACFISPYENERSFVRNLVGRDFVEVFVKCSIEECERRDVKGLYKKAREGQIKNFTGVNDPYEVPEDAELILDTTELSVEECVDKIMEYLKV